MTIAEQVTRAKADLDAVYAAGKQAEWDAFWDAFQANGKRVSYDYAFAGSGWTAETFKPKYDIKPNNAQYMFAYGSLSGVDLAAQLETLGVVLDTSKAVSFNNFTYYNSPSRFPTIDTRGANSLSNLIHGSNGVSIDRLILRDDGSQTLSNTFNSSTMNRVIIEGVIGQEGFSTKNSPNLDKESHESIVAALSTTTSGRTVTLSLAAVNRAFETRNGASNGSTSAEWLALVATRSNWTVALA